MLLLCAMNRTSSAVASNYIMMQPQGAIKFNQSNTAAATDKAAVIIDRRTTEKSILRIWGKTH
jgi:hypothetical protein